jgi:hypothetical protein
VGLNLARLTRGDWLLLLLVPVWLFVVGMGAWGRSVSEVRFIPAEIGSAQSRRLEARVVVDEPTFARSQGLCAGFAEHREVEIRGQSAPRTVYALPLRPAGEAGS